MVRTVLVRVCKSTAIMSGSVVGMTGAYALWEYCNTPSDQISSHHNPYSIYVQSLTNLAMSKLGSSAIREFRRECQKSASVNEKLLLHLLDRCKDTDYGKEHNLASIRSREEFRYKHPITTHEHYQSYISRIYNGETNVMFPDRTRMIATTSGTSGTQNLIPVPTYQRKVFFTKGIAITFGSLQNGVKHRGNDKIKWPNLQKSCKLMHEPKFKYSPSGLKVGPNSSSPKDNKHLLQLYTTPAVAFDVQSETELLFLHALYALLDENLGFLESNFCNRILNFFVLLDDQWENLIQTIETGSLPLSLNIDDAVRRELESGLKPNPYRAEELKRIKEEHDEGVKIVDNDVGHANRPSFARKLWPNLHTILASETGTFAIYGEMLRQQYIGNDITIYSPLYAATEGLLGVNPNIEGKTYILHPCSMFYEFYPIEKDPGESSHDNSIDSEKTLFIEQLQPGKEYEVIITNLTGLYRYRFGDVIRCVGYEGEAPIVEIAYRIGQFLNAGGERTSEETFYKALSNTVAKDWGLSLKEYTTVEYFLKGNRKPRYIVFVELADKETGSISVERSLTRREKIKLDERLGEENKSYKSLRSRGRLEEIEVVTVRKGTFERLRKQMVSCGVGTTQIKQPRVTRNEMLIRMLEESKVDK